MKKRENLSLYGGQAEQFRELHEELARELGRDPEQLRKTRTFDHLIENYDGDLL